MPRAEDGYVNEEQHRELMRLFGELEPEPKPEGDSLACFGSLVAPATKEEPPVWKLAEEFAARMKR